MRRLIDTRLQVVSACLRFSGSLLTMVTDGGAYGEQ